MVRRQIGIEAIPFHIDDFESRYKNYIYFSFSQSLAQKENDQAKKLGCNQSFQDAAFQELSLH